MCELMGLSFARPVSADFSIREFALRSEQNADGWGLAWYPDRSLAVVKEPVRWQSSQYTRFLESYANLQARVYIAHVRHKTTGGEATHADTHPFAREWAGRDYCFAHNGTLQGDFWQLPLGRFKPVGNTDSEFLFCHLLDEVSRRDDLLETESSWRWLAEKLVAVNRWGKLNALLSDGERLFCYHDVLGFKGLTYRPTSIGDNEIRRFEDAGLRMDVVGEAANHGFVVATCPLSETGWHRFQPGELVAFERGTMRFSSKGSSSSAP
ncbi:MAG: class II glutamine amidotransferase [Gemmataceae bacterium]